VPNAESHYCSGFAQIFTERIVSFWEKSVVDGKNEKYLPLTSHD
jgi:hypothetical protein